MQARGRYQRLIGCVFTLVLILFVAGCGGGGTSSSEISSACGDSFPNAILPSGEVVHADTGDIVAVRVNQTATLDGCGSSTALVDPLTYAWSFTSKPDASTAQLRNATSASPSFIGDVAGTYRVQLVVSA